MAADQTSAAVETLNRWLADHGAADSRTTPDDWAITAFEDALLFTPTGQRRSNRLYLVRGEAVSAFSPSTTSLDEVYTQLGHPQRPA